MGGGGGWGGCAWVGVRVHGCVAVLQSQDGKIRGTLQIIVYAITG